MWLREKTSSAQPAQTAITWFRRQKGSPTPSSWKRSDFKPLSAKLTRTSRIQLISLCMDTHLRSATTCAYFTRAGAPAPSPPSARLGRRACIQSSSMTRATLLNRPQPCGKGSDRWAIRPHIQSLVLCFKTRLRGNKDALCGSYSVSKTGSRRNRTAWFARRLASWFCSRGMWEMQNFKVRDSLRHIQ
jgi:hypothetical protein